MPRARTESQDIRIYSEVTRPIFLCKLFHSGAAEYLSASGEITYDGQLYSGLMNVTGIRGNESFLIDLPPTASRVGQIQSGSWRYQSAILYYIPASMADGDTFTADDAILICDGTIDKTQFRGDRVRVDCSNKYLNGQLSPLNTLDEVATMIPPAGTSVTWEGETRPTVSSSNYVKNTSVASPGRRAPFQINQNAVLPT
jgi:hypothetical protein